jgi:hypothetical protein
MLLPKSLNTAATTVFMILMQQLLHKNEQLCTRLPSMFGLTKQYTAISLYYDTYYTDRLCRRCISWTNSAARQLALLSASDHVLN